MTPTIRTIVRNIEWEPFGGVRKYEVATGANLSNFNTVEYFKGSLAPGDTPEASVNKIACSPPSLGPQVDGTGRLRALLVSNGVGSGLGGDIFRQVYTWNADELRREQTCVERLGQTIETSQLFTYDNTRRLTSSTSTGSTVITKPVAPGSSRSYGYDRRGNLTSFTADGCTRSVTYLTGDREEIFSSMVPQSADPECNGRFSGPTLFFDADGRTSRKATAFYWWYADLGYAPDSSGLDTVVKSVGVTRAGSATANYSYRYDAFNRRRLKVYPFDSLEEFFYDVGNQMLTQRSGNVVGVATSYTVDDFVWLDGKAIAMVRGSFDLNY
ncbi:MAG: hypothetical protein AB1938_07175, partial [Myxococcota bacterium]